MKTRNPKTEIRKKAEGRNPKPESLNEKGESSVLPPGRRASDTHHWASAFGLRVSPFLRPSAFGFRISAAALLFITSTLLLAADTNTPDALSSSLRPPRPEILPTFWEQYGAWVIVFATLLLAVVAVVVWLATRPKPAVPVPWSLLARRELEPLAPQPEDGTVLSRISQILRHHLASAFGLPSGEVTTSEFCRSLVGSDQIGPDLSGEITVFLKECDLRKFAPAPPASSCDAVARSLRIVERAEKRLADLQRAAAVSSPDSHSSPSSKVGQQQGQASGA